MENRYFIINKPFNMVSQFVSPDNVRLLSDLDFTFPEGTHAIGRLDNESEGLLLLTTDKRITRLMYSGDKHHERSYLVLVQNEVSAEKFAALKTGVTIKVQGGEAYIAKPVSVKKVQDAKNLYSYSTDERENYPHTWLLITLTEGKFRQVRKMMMAIHHRCLRLIRVSIGNLKIENMEPGSVKEVSKEYFFSAIGL